MGSTYQQSEVITQAPQQKNHNLAYGAGGAVAGLAAGALLMHEGHKVGMFNTALAYPCVRLRDTMTNTFVS